MLKQFFCMSCLLVCLFCCNTILYAEIDTVTITWNKVSCNEGCGELVKKRLEGIPAVARVVVNPGEATMYWKPGEKFTYLMVRRPTQFVGVGLDAMYVKVRGTVRVSGGKAYLTSIGDNTKFELTAAPAPKYGTYTQYTAPELYKLLPDQIEAFKKAQREDTMVTASGFLLMPYRRALTIVLDNYRIEQEPQ